MALTAAISIGKFADQYKCNILFTSSMPPVELFKQKAPLVVSIDAGKKCGYIPWKLAVTAKPSGHKIK